MAENDITALILTHNEEKHIERCIKSVKSFANDVVVVDSFSSDNTVRIATSLDARVFKHEWVNYATQFQWGLDNTNISTEWVMRIDADEYLELDQGYLLEKINNSDSNVSGYYIKRKYFFLGKWIRFGAMYPIYVLRIWRRNAGRIESRWMDEHIVLEYGITNILDTNIVDDNKNSISWWTSKHNSYATREMIDILNLEYKFSPVDEGLSRESQSQANLKRTIKEKLYSKLPIFIRPLLYFLYRYFIRLGFLDGVKGFAFHFLQGYWYRVLVDLKVLEAKIWINGESSPGNVKKILMDKTGLKL